MNCPGVERKLAAHSICVVKYSMLRTFMTSCLHKLVRVCLAVISLTAFNNCDVKYFTWKYQTIRHFLCSCSCLFTFLLSSQFYWHIRLKSTAYFFWPPCVLLYVYILYVLYSAVCLLDVSMFSNIACSFLNLVCVSLHIRASMYKCADV